MRSARRLSLPLAGLLILAVVCCVSRTVPEARFRDSRLLQAGAPSIAVPDPDHFTCAVVGDVHAGSVERLNRIFAAAAAEGDAFVALLGDIIDKGDAESFHAVQTAIAQGPFAGKVLPVIGNHDIF